ncbi:MAG: ABC transporter permease [Clostridiales bacterium]|nr:ABC transporter permease [Clostridiales bacterium]
MKLLPSIRRELTLLSRSIYFYSEIAVAVICLVVLLFVMPEHFDARATEYAFIDLPREQAEAMEEALFADAGPAEGVTLKNRGHEIPARLYTTDMKYVYVVDNRASLSALCEDTGHIGTLLHEPGADPAYEYFLQGNETARYKEYVTLLLSSDFNELLDAADKQEVRALEENPRKLADRQSVLPLMLSVNCVLMGILVTAGYIVEDKKTKVIKALRVTPSRMGVYLTAKMSAVTLTSLAVGLIITAPVMGGGANYFLLCLIIVCGSFFTVSIGALLASFFEDIGKAFTAVFAILVVLMIPGILSMIAGLNAPWVKVIPSYYIVESVKESLLDRDAGYVLLCCAGLAAGGLILMPLSARRYKAAGIGVGG